MAKLRIYWVELSDDGEGVGVVAASYYEAKVIAANEVGAHQSELRCRMMKNIKLKKSDKVGIIDTADGLRRGIYGDSREMEVKCEVCGKEKDFCIFDDKKIKCSECADKGV